MGMGFCRPYTSHCLDKHSRVFYDSEPIPGEVVLAAGGGVEGSPAEKMVSCSQQLGDGHPKLKRPPAGI